MYDNTVVKGRAEHQVFWPDVSVDIPLVVDLPENFHVFGKLL